MVLSTNPSVKDLRDCSPSILEKLLRQLLASCVERRALNGDQGEPFDLHKVLYSGVELKRQWKLILDSLTVLVTVFDVTGKQFPGAMLVQKLV